MGLHATSQTIWVSSLFQVWKLENMVTEERIDEGFDGLYVPQISYTTGNLDIHDMAIDQDGRPVFANTLFSCLATVSTKHSFVPLWRPEFISHLVPEDRCHLNGLAMVKGLPEYVTVLGVSDQPQGWRKGRQDGGKVIHVSTGSVVASGLCMPHSPRWHQGKLWLLESGTGYFGYIDLGTGLFERVAFCPGFLRGLAFFGRYAMIGLSEPRPTAFSGLPLDKTLERRRMEAICGLAVIDLKTGSIAHWLRLSGVIRELYDVAVIPGLLRPKALGLKTNEIQRYFSFPIH